MRTATKEKFVDDIGIPTEGEVGLVPFHGVEEIANCCDHCMYS
jgi:hypothetical protein